MTNDVSTRFRAIRDALLCAFCNYPLRGLPGEKVICPECGETNDISEMMAAQAGGHWRHMPVYDHLVLPLFWIMCSSLLLWLYAMIAPAWQVGLGTLLSLLVWVWLLRKARKLFGVEVGLWLALIVHLVFAGYIIGGIGCVAAMVFLGVQLLSGAWRSAQMAFVALVVCLALIALAQMLDRYVVRECFRRALRTMDA